MPQQGERIARVVALGASNLTRGLQTVVATARTAWGPDVDVVATLGYGRSYGATSAFLVRKLPAILDSGVWRALQSSPRVPTRALITDVGNDIIYGFPATRILAWIDESIARLATVSDDIVLTGLPMDSIRRLTPRLFLAARTVLAPSCRLSQADMSATAEEVQAGLERLAAARGVRFVDLRPSWYGLDPIHIRPALRQPAWQEILGASCDVEPSRLEALRLFALRPERQWLCGMEQRADQQGLRLTRGGRIWLY